LRLSYQIPLLTWLTLIFTIFVNIFAFQYFINALLPEYLSQVYPTEEGATEPENIETLIKIGELDSDAQDDYKVIINELSNLSTSLKNIADNPDLYISTSEHTLEVGPWGFSIPIGTGWYLSSKNIIDAIANPMSFDRNSPEWVFIVNLLWRILLTNIIWLTLILALYFLWIRRLFSPINIIIEKLRKFIDTSEYSGIDYVRNDEFFPLISTINNLYRSLSIQENIRSNFLSDLSHEIRTPITAVKCYLEGIEDGILKIDTKTVPLLQTELSRLTQITEKMMEYENLAQSILGDVHVERFQVRKILEEISATYLPQLNKSHQKIIFNFPTDTMTRMDKSMFAQVAHNIFSNFLKYAGKNATLTCSYTKTPAAYTFYFSDDGIGIPDNEIDLVKEKFYRVDKWRTRDEYISMGIGLSIVDRIARLHNGSLEIQKNTPKGVIVKITIKR
jgi:signal transduction histidine kinase